MQHFMKKAAALALAMVMALSLATMALAADFEDMPTDWSADAVQSAVANGLLSGKDGKIAASDNLTRAEMATIITRAFGAEVKDNISFTDVASDAWYNGYVAQVVHMGVMSGKGGNTFAPAANITRQEVFTVLARALKLADGSAEDLAAFSDADKVASWAVPTVSALVKAGYVSGSNGALNPTANITRAEFAQVMYNIFNNAYLNQAATYEEVDGKNVIISSANVTVKGVEIEGDVVIADGVGDGDVFLEDVTVGGRVVVRGGGMNSVHFRGSKAGSVIVTKVDGNVRVVFDEESTVETVSVEGGKASTDVRIEGAVKNVVVNDATSTVVLADAKVEKLDVAAANAKISLAGATTVAEMTVAEGATNTTMAAETTAEVTKLTTAEDVFIDNEDVIKESNDEEKINPERPAESGDPAESTAPSGDGNVEPDNNQQGETAVTPPDAPAEKPTGGNNVAADANVKESDTPGTPTGTPTTDTCTKDPDGEGPQTAPGHTWDTGRVTKEATCKETGTKVYTCTVCGMTKTDTLGKLAHTKGALKDSAKPTCAAAGWNRYKCATAGCDKEIVEEVEATGHGYSAGWVMTDTQHYHQCPTCGTSVTKNPETGAITESAAVNHTYTKKTDGTATSTLSEAKWTSTGAANHTLTCTTCGHTKTEAHGVLAYTADTKTVTSGESTTTVDVGTHTGRCSKCDYTTLPAAHTFAKGTGDKASKHVCSVCSSEHAIKAAPAEDSTEWVVTKPAACGVAGSKYYLCDCGMKVVVEITALEHIDVDGEGVRFSLTTEPTCTQAGVISYYCTKCNTWIATNKTSVGTQGQEGYLSNAALGHDYSITRNPTLEEFQNENLGLSAGDTVDECSRCQAVRKTPSDPS